MTEVHMCEHVGKGFWRIWNSTTVVPEWSIDAWLPAPDIAPMVVR